MRAEGGGPLRHAGRALAILAAAGFLALLAYGLIARSPDTTLDESLAQDRPVPAPALDLPLLRRGSPDERLASRLRAATSDGRLTLRELRGVPVVLNFWASWCVPCRDEARPLERGWRRAGPNGVLFLGLNMQDITEDAQSFADSFGLSYPNVRDRGNDVARAWGVTGVPETFFVSGRGLVVGHVTGVVSGPQLEAGVAAARTGRLLGSREGGERRSTR